MSRKSPDTEPIRIGADKTDFLVKTLAAHPYLWAFALCLFVHPFYLGSEENVPSNALLIEFLGVCAAGIYIIYKIYKSEWLTKTYANIIGVLFLAVNVMAAKLYSKQATKGIWMLMGGLAILVALYYFADTKKYTAQLNSLLILGASFIVKFYYVYYTSVYTRQHDVHTFGGDDGHAAYIEYLLYNHKLPDFDVREVWQFCHPPLHHIICAVWIEINENILGIGHNPARESLQTLTLFYSMTIMITAYKLLRHFKLKGAALYIPLCIVSFHPAFIMFSGSINNDVLSVAFMMGAVLCTLHWYENPNVKDILKIALCVGLGMMTKLSAALVAPPIAVVFLIVLIKKFIKGGFKSSLRIIGQFAAFAVVCVPTALWFEIKNYIKYKVPITYVQEMPTTVMQYIGDQNFISRITDFSAKQFESVFEQWTSVDESGTLQGYNEYNPLIALLKNSLFGENINEGSFSSNSIMPTVATFLFWVGVILAAGCFIMMIINLFTSCKLNITQKLLFGLFYLTLVGNFYKMANNYPFTCTMNFRYITPTVIISALFMGITVEKLKGKNILSDTLVSIITVLSGAFCVMSVLLFIQVCYPAMTNS